MLVWYAAAALAQEPAVKEVHRSEVDVVTPHVAVLPEPTPAYARCLVRVVIGSDGAPQSATPKEGCAMAEKAVAAAMAGRWKLKEGQAAPLAFYVPVESRPLISEGSVRFQLVAGMSHEDQQLYADQSCPLRMGIAADGQVDVVLPGDACAEALRPVVSALVMMWQAEPYVVDGKAVPAWADLAYQVPPKGPRMFHHTELQVLKRVMPPFPKEAMRSYAAGSSVECGVRVYLDEEGVPYDVGMESCPEPFHAVTRETLLKWRWKPATYEGEAVPAQFTIKISYKYG
jgi:hypothetical protein